MYTYWSKIQKIWTIYNCLDIYHPKNIFKCVKDVHMRNLRWLKTEFRANFDKFSVNIQVFFLKKKIILFGFKFQKKITLKKNLKIWNYHDNAGIPLGSKISSRSFAFLSSQTLILILRSNLWSFPLIKSLPSLISRI